MCPHMADYLKLIYSLKCVWINGTISAQERRKRIQCFKGDCPPDLEADVLVCTYGTLSEGVNLVCANVVVQYDPPLSHAESVQSENRLVFFCV